MVENEDIRLTAVPETNHLDGQPTKDNVQSQLQDYKFFEQITRAVDDSQDLLEIMRMIQNYFTGMFSFDHLTLFVQLPNEKFCVIHDVVAQDDIIAYPAGSLMPLKGTSIEYVLSTARTQYNPDVQSYQQFMDDQELAYDGIRAMVRIPLIHKEQAFAVMTMNSIRPNHFLPAQITLMEKIAARLCTGIYSLKLAYTVQKTIYMDALTDTLNRSFLSDMMVNHKNGIIETIAGLKIPDSPDVSLIFADVNRFKQFNEKFGNAKGDSLLTEVAQLVREVVKDAGFMIRFGGDEFLVVLPGVTALDAERLQNEIKLRVLTFNSMSDPSAGKMSLRLTLQVASGEWANFPELLQAATK